MGPLTTGAAEALDEILRLAGQKATLGEEYLALSKAQAEVADLWQKELRAEGVEPGGRVVGTEGGTEPPAGPEVEMLRLLQDKQRCIDRSTVLDAMIAQAEERLAQVPAATLPAPAGAETLAWEELAGIRRRTGQVLAQAREIESQVAKSLEKMRLQVTECLRGVQAGRGTLKAYTPGGRQWSGVFIDRRE